MDFTGIVAYRRHPKAAYPSQIAGGLPVTPIGNDIQPLAKDLIAGWPGGCFDVLRLAE